MKTSHAIPLLALLATSANADSYSNTLAQVQITSLGLEVPWIVPVEDAGSALSALAIDPGGARFELWTVNNNTGEDFLLDQKYVSAYVPQAVVTITSGDPYTTIPRTRADQPFAVSVFVDGIVNDFLAPEAARMVELVHYAQSYGEDGNGTTINRDDATEVAKTFVNQNGTSVLDYAITVIPNADRSKVRGEERFTVFSLPDYQVLRSVISSKYIQIWPVADGSITGIEDGDAIRFETPAITFRVNDAYPNSFVYAQAYKGNPVLGTAGKFIAGRNYSEAVPQDYEQTVDNWDNIIDSSGTWTVELLSQTPFGIDRLDYVTFSIDRDIKVNTGLTTSE